MSDWTRDKDPEIWLLSRAMGGNVKSREIATGVHEHVAKETPMQWTTEFPTKPGFYWVRKYLTESHRLVGLKPFVKPIIVRFDGERDFYLTGVELRVCFESVLSAERYGPIEPPE